MEIFNLSVNTKVNRVIPKNTFESYTNTKQKKEFTDKVIRIIWTNKLSQSTTNLKCVETQEIQIFKIELKIFEKIPQIISIIDKAIPYPIIFIIQYKEQSYFSTSVKHPHPTNEDNAVIDWTFNSDWKENTIPPYQINLKSSLDEVHKDFCIQLSGNQELKGKHINKIVEYQKEKYSLENEINKLKQQITRSKSFKEKVELNLRLKELEKGFSTNIN